MSIPSASHLFKAGLGNPSSQSDYLDTIVQKEIELASRDVEMRTPPPSSPHAEDLVSELGEYFARTATMWAQLTQQLIKGPHITEASYQAHERSRRQSHMSDLAEVATIDYNLSKLKKISDLSLQFSHEVGKAWRPQPGMMPGGEHGVMQTSISPFCDTRMASVSEAMSLSSEPESTHFNPSRKLLPEKGNSIQSNIGADASVSDDSSDDEEQFQAIDMEALRQRGKGFYSCPKGVKCDKGGVDKDGNVVIFDRNSSFAQHCNKHRKPWRCDVPGCPNPPKKRRFARRDGLERHKTTVKHYLVT